MKNILLRVAAFSMVVGIVVYSCFFVPNDLLGRFDFTAFMTGANMVKAGDGGLLYQIPKQIEYQKIVTHEDSFVLFRNPPHLTLFFLPLSLFSLPVAYKIYVLLAVSLLIYAAYLISGEFRKVGAHLVFFLSLFFIPCAISVITGQISVLLLVVLLLVLRSLRKGNSWLSGFLVCLLFVKPQYLLILPFAFVVAKGRKEFFFGAVWSLALQAVLFIFLAGVKSFLDYPSFILGTESFGLQSDIYAQASFTSLLFNLAKVLPFLSGIEKYINLIFYFLTLLWFTVSYSEYRVGRERFFCSAILFTLAFVPHFWEYDLVLILPALFFFLTQAKPSKRKQVNHISYLVAFALFFSWTVRFLGYPYITSTILIFSGAFALLMNKSAVLKTKRTQKILASFQKAQS